MISIASLWLPILVSAVGVFVASSIIHMVLKYHHSDWVKLPGEEDIMDVVRTQDVPPGDYFMPHGTGPEAMKDPEFIERMTRGPYDANERHGGHTYEAVYSNKVSGFTRHTFSGDLKTLTTEFIGTDGASMYSFSVTRGARSGTSSITPLVEVS